MDLFFAIKSDNVEFLKSKLDDGLCPNEMIQISVKNDLPELFQYETPLLSISCYFGSINSFNLLISSTNININLESNSPYRFRPIHYSIANNQKEIFDSLVNLHADIHGILFASIHFLNFAFFEFIIENHLDDVNFSNDVFQAPILEAIKNQKSSKMATQLLHNGATFDNDLVEFCQSTNDYKHFCELLNGFSQQNLSNLEHGIITPLHIAADQNDFEEAKKIIEDGTVDINAITNNGDTALMKASHRGSLQIVRLILEQPKVNVDINQTNKGGVCIYIL